jgi:hypothetical protein
VSHFVRHTGVEIHAHTLDLDSSPQALEAQIDNLAVGIASAAS